MGFAPRRSSSRGGRGAALATSALTERGYRPGRAHVGGSSGVGVGKGGCSGAAEMCRTQGLRWGDGVAGTCGNAGEVTVGVQGEAGVGEFAQQEGTLGGRQPDEGARVGRGGSGSGLA